VEAPAKKHDKVWFSGYTGQKTLILDDFDSMFCSLPFLKRLLDKYKLKVEIKGGFAWACWTTVVITSNRAPCMWYEDTATVHYKPEDINALKRRIHEIRKQNENNMYQLEDWDANQLGDFQRFQEAAHPDEDIIVDCGSDEQLY